MRSLLNDTFLFETILSGLDSHQNQTKLFNGEIEIAVPGLTKEDIEITVKNRHLEVSYQGTGKFTKAFKKTYLLSNTVNIDNIHGTVKDGVLSIKLPKIEEIVNEKKVILN